jgi:CheY-like chemotaxis protein
MNSHPTAELLCVLAVDDHRDTADSLGQLLTLWGHRPLVAYAAASALATALDERPDVVLIDLGLPGVDGWELARRLRAEPSLEGILLVAVTGYGMEADRARSDAAGIDMHLLKPVDPDVLQRLLAGCKAPRRGCPR